MATIWYKNLAKTIGVFVVCCTLFAALFRLGADDARFVAYIPALAAAAAVAVFYARAQRCVLRERELQRHIDRLLQEKEQDEAQRMLLSAIAHDLRTPMAGILGASQAILEQAPVHSAIPPLAEDIQDTAQWLIRLVENALAAAKLPPGASRLNAAPQSAEEVLAQAVSIVRKRHAGRNIHAAIPREIITAPMDAMMICQVLINLLENALQSTPPEGHIRVQLEKLGAFARFEVDDDGRGIPGDMAANLFSAAYTGNALSGLRGAGMGLPICQSIVRAHGGEIQWRNKDEGGAVFSFLLPLREGGVDT